MHYEDRIFFRLNDKTLVAIPHEDYVKLVHRQSPMPEYAGQKIRLAIFYVEMKGSRAKAIINANYGLLGFDETGFADPTSHKHTLHDNREFFEAVKKSNYDNIDCDPEIQQLRNELGDEFSWVPTDKELGQMVNAILSSSEYEEVDLDAKSKGGGANG